MNAPSAIISYGRTLARRMLDIDVLAYLSKLDASQANGVVHVAVCDSHVPSVKNVEAWTEGLPPDVAVAALQVAENRLRVIHGVSDGPLKFRAVDLYDAEVMRARAEQLVDMCRASRIGVVGGRALHTFDQSRENCVRAVMLALASASVTPTSLAG